MGVNGKSNIQRTLSDTFILKPKFFKNIVDRHNNRKPIGPKKNKSLSNVESNHTTQNNKFKIDEFFVGTRNNTLNLISDSDSTDSENELNFDGIIYTVHRKEKNCSSKRKVNFQRLNLRSGKKIYRSSKVDTKSTTRLTNSKDSEPSAEDIMNYRGPSRTATANYYLHDAWMTKNVGTPKRVFKSPNYINGLHPFNYLDNSMKYRTRQRSVSPNLPKIPYLEKSNHYSHPNPPRNLPKNTKLIFKNKINNKKEPLPEKDSKKSIPDHALMKSLLSGLSIFDSKSKLDLVPTRHGGHKSMGNIKANTKKEFDVYPNPKSSMDFTEQSCKNATMGSNTANFKNHKTKCCDVRPEYECLQRAQGNFTKDKYKFDRVGDCRSALTSQQCLDGSQTCRLGCESISFTDDVRESTYENGKNPNASNSEQCVNLKIRTNTVSPNKINIVQERKRFFENQKKLMDKKNFYRKIIPSSQAFVINCVEKKIQSEYDIPEEITEIYRNFQSVHSTSTISKRSSSLPPVSKYGSKTNPRNMELFNPDYNFDGRNRMCARKSLIGSIRSKVFQTVPDDYNLDADEWNCSPLIPKFPKETRTAMSIILSNRNSNVSCRYCHERMKARQVVSIETQTSPVPSRQNIVACPNDSKIPCLKNLLCDKGYHRGRCEKIVRDKLNITCTEDCVCRSAGRMIRYENLIWPGHPNYFQKTREVTSDRKNNDLMEDEFLKYIRVDMETSAESLGRENVEKNVSELPICTSYKMNGLNGHTNGDLNGCGDIITQNQQRGCWTIGLINSKYRYLTAETFGFKINANGTSLKKKQIWTLEPDTTSGNESFIYLKSHLDKYLAVDSFGNVTCEGEEKEAGSKFQISVAEDGTGRWGFRNVVRGYFLGSSSDKLTCTAKVPGDSEFWHIHLAARPQVNLRSVGRKRFAHLSENLDEIHVDANIPWGEDTLFTLEFHADESGKYALHTCNNKYLSNGGKLVDTCNKDCLFSAEYHSGQLALRDRNGAYLSPIGSKAVLKTRSNTVTKDELFSLEDSLPQASFVAALNSRYVSVKQGVDVTANQDEISDHETFQLEFDWSTKRWYIRTMQDKYWTLETGGGIQASGDKRSSNALFDLAWQEDGSLAFRANNGRYVITKRSGHLYATSDIIDDNCKYFFYLVNRPILVLKCEQGFVGYKSTGNPKLECNKATYECIQVERSDKGIIHFKGQNGKFWHVDSEGVTADSDTPEGFYLELREPTRLCIKTANGNYLTASKNGMFRLGDSSIENATQWEY